MLDQAFHATKRLGKREQVAALERAARLLQPTLDLDTDNAAEAVHLTPGKCMLGMALEAWIDHPLNGGMLLKPTRQLKRAFAMGAHAQVQRLQATHGQKGIEGARYRADGVLQKAHLLGQFTIAGHHDAAHHIGVAIEVFGGRMQY